MDELHRPQIWIRPYYRSFNGIRGLAVFMVFLEHYAGFWHSPVIENTAWVGVDLFFVLSGFLITGILYDSLADPRFFRNFYIRRALRIFPVFYGFFLLLFLLTPILHLHYDATLLSFFFYVGNLIVPFLDLSRHNPTIITIFSHGKFIECMNLGHLWSLCVEEQFYLMWPSVVWFVRDRRRLMHVCLWGSVIVLLGRIYIRTHASPAQLNSLIMLWSTYTRCDTLLIGSFLALWLRGHALSRFQIKRLAYCLFWGAAILLAAGIAHTTRMRSISDVITNRFITSFGFTLFSLMSVAIILFALDEEGILSRVLRWKPLSAFGVISYGFYFFHMLPESSLTYIAVSLYPRTTVLMPFLAFAITLLLAMLSFHFFESPFLKLKKRWAPGHRSVPSGNEDITPDKIALPS